MYISYEDQETSPEVLVGKTLTEIRGMEKDSDEVTFICADGSRYGMYHSQDCCETVYLEDVNGDVVDLLNSPILEASVRTSEENPEGVKLGYQDSFLWTFYHIRTAKGMVVLRWYGDSNGYYSVEVGFGPLKAEYNHE